MASSIDRQRGGKRRRTLVPLTPVNTCCSFSNLRQLFQFVQQIRAHAGGVVDEVLLLDDVEHGQRGGAGQVVAAEGGAQLSVHGGEHRADEHTAHGEAVTDALGHGDEVGADALVLVGEELAGTSVAALNLVEDEHRVVAGAGLACGVHELVGGQLDASHALYALDDDGADVALVNLGRQCGARR